LDKRLSEPQRRSGRGGEGKNSHRVNGDKINEACSTIREMKNASKILVGKPKRKKTLGRPRRRWNYNINITAFRMAQGAVLWRNLVNTAMNIYVKVGEILVS
jgi:hypothetical protein